MGQGLAAELVSLLIGAGQQIVTQSSYYGRPCRHSRVPVSLSTARRSACQPYILPHPHFPVQPLATGFPTIGTDDGRRPQTTSRTGTTPSDISRFSLRCSHWSIPVRIRHGSRRNAN
jgi:hypothetical protein